MQIIIKLNYHLEDTKVSVPFTKPNAEKCVIGQIYLFLKYYFTSQHKNPSPEF